MSWTRTFLAILLILLAATLFIVVLATRETGKRIAHLEAQRSLFETRHGAIEYLVWGAGPPVLVVHGAGGGFDQGRLLAETLGGDAFTFISISRFGYLGSDLPEVPSTKAQAEAVVDLLDNLGVIHVHVLAMSGGVPPSLKLAEIYPERVDRMVLLSAAPFTPFSPDVEGRPVPTWVYAALLGNDVAYWTLTKLARSQLEAAFDARADLRQGLSSDEEKFISDLIDGFLPASRRLPGVNNEGAAVDSDAVYDLELIEARVLVVHARDDRLNPFAVGETVAKRISDSEFIAFETGGHLLLGHHSELRDRIEWFLEG